MSDLPLIRSHERMDFKRCPKKWYWKWRMGLVPKTAKFGAVDLGTWLHDALAIWYGSGYTRVGNLAEHFNAAADAAISRVMKLGAPEHVIETAEELAALGDAMATAYEKHYGSDEAVNVLAAEIPLEFSISDSSKPGTAALHLLKPDMVYADSNDDVWLMEHKSAAQIRTEHLVIDDQARPYGAMAEQALRRLGIIRKDQQFRGIMYNFLRKALPDERLVNSEGKALNKNGTVSKRQPAPVFLRHPVHLSRKAKVLTLKRVQAETINVTAVANELRNKWLDPADLGKTPDHACARYCDFFAMCSVEEQGGDFRSMQSALYIRKNPYDYEETITEQTGGWNA